MKQQLITINNVQVPILVEKEVKYYPISYIYEKILFRESPRAKELKTNYGQYMNKFSIDFSFIDGNKNTQPCNCITEDGLRGLLVNLNVGKYTVEKRISLNGLLKYLNMKLVEINDYEIFNKKQIDNLLNGCDEFTKDCVLYYLKEKDLSEVKWKRCNKCNRWFPLDKSFFFRDYRTNTFNHMCLNCQIGTRISHPDNKLNLAYLNYGLEVYKNYRDNNAVEIYKHSIELGTKKLPLLIQNKESYITIIKYLYNEGKITKDNLTSSLLKDTYLLSCNSKNLTMKEVYNVLFGEDCHKYPWKYPKMIMDTSIDYREGKEIFNNYLSEHNIKIDNIFTFNYSKILVKAKLRQFENNTLEFIVNYHDKKYAGYKFKTGSVNYYKNEESRNFDLKYFIEVDQQIPIEKIPLYITKMCLQRNARSLYYILHDKSYYSDLFDWINSIYPDKFIKADFVINQYRDEFDSNDEMLIDEQLRKYFKNVIYNRRKDTDPINILGMCVDWIIPTDEGCYLVEYFGLYVHREGNKMTSDYIKRADIKINKYKNLVDKGYYKFIDIYPDDLKNNFEGLKIKLNKINK